MAFVQRISGVSVCCHLQELSSEELHGVAYSHVHVCACAQSSPLYLLSSFRNCHYKVLPVKVTELAEICLTQSRG